MWSPETLVIVLGTFLLAGVMKGVVGLGLPTVSLAILSATLGHKEAIALILVPSLLTNVWQGLAGGAFLEIMRRLWALFAMALLGTWLGVGVLAGADARVVAGFFGALLCIYSLFSLATPQIPPPGRFEPWLSPLIGGIAGVITGITGSFIVPGILYLQALGLGRDLLVQTMGVTFTVLTIALGAGMAQHALLTDDLVGISAVSVVPAVLGMVAGQRIRRRLPEEGFRKVFFGALLLLGLYIVGRTFL